MTDKDVGSAAISQQDDSVQTRMQESYLQNIDALKEGDLVEGRVVQCTEEFVFVDIGYKSEGKVPRSEFLNGDPAPNDILSVVLVKKETASGEIVVSKKRADEKLRWKIVTDAYANKSSIVGVISKEVKGGFEVDLGLGIAGFLPQSKASTQRAEPDSALVGTSSSFYIERLHAGQKVNIVLNRRRFLEEESERRKADFFAHAEIGSVVKGEVKSLTSFGAFIDLGGFDGLLHINDMSWGHVVRPRDYVRKGQQVELRVVRLDPEEKRINLSLKHMTVDPWSSFEEKYHAGDIVKGRVTKLAEYGAFIELEEGIEGLAHISEFSWLKRVTKPEEMVRVGDSVDCMILSYDLLSSRISLGLKQVTDNPWDTIQNRYPMGMRCKAKVTKIIPAGLILELEEGIEALLHSDDISWTKPPANLAEAYAIDQELEVIVIKNDNRNRLLRVGIKQLSEDPWMSFAKAYRVGSVLEVDVVSISDQAITVKVQGDLEGFIRLQDLHDDYDKSNTPPPPAPGTKIKAIVAELKPDRQRLRLSVRGMLKMMERSEISRFMQSDHSDSGYTLGDIIKDKNNNSTPN